MKIKKTGTLIFSMIMAASLFLSACGNNDVPVAGTEAVQTTEAAESKASEAVSEKLQRVQTLLIPMMK